LFAPLFGVSAFEQRIYVIMMKFFRKYNKQLLAVFMVALMVVFIGGSALQSLMTPEQNYAVANSNYGPITLRDQQEAAEATMLLERLGLSWKQPVGMAAPPIETPMDWILLLREAKMLGTEVGLDAVRGTLSDSAMQGVVNQVARALRIKPDRIHQALAQLRTVQRTVTAIGGATVPSEAELRVATRNALETVSFKAILAPAKAFIDDKQTFTDDEMKKQFAAYRETARGPGLNFGYYRAPTLKVQYITIDRAAIAAAVGIANQDSKAKAYYEQRKALDPVFKRPGNLLADPDAPPPDPYLTFEEAKEKALEGLRKEQATEEAGRLADWLLQFASEAFIEVERGGDLYKPAPVHVARLEYYNELIQKVPPKLTFPKSVSVGMTDFFALEKADRVPELGNAMYRPDRGVAQSFASLVFKNKAMQPKVPTDEGGNTAEYLSLYQTGPYALTEGTTGNLYLYRIVEAQSGRAAESLDEVRDEVIADLRTLRGFEAAKKRAEAFRRAVPQQPLKAAYEADTDLVAFKGKSVGNESGYFEPPLVTRVSRTEAPFGRPAGGANTNSGLGKLPNDAIDQIFALDSTADKTAVLELKDRAAILLVQWVETKPATQDQFDTLRKDLASKLSDVHFRDAVSSWLDSSQIQARTGFTLKTK
jgi:hypothetical protein